jgi:hypothetical protein
VAIHVESPGIGISTDVLQKD